MRFLANVRTSYMATTPNVLCWLKKCLYYLFNCHKLFFFVHLIFLTEKIYVFEVKKFLLY